MLPDFFTGNWDDMFQGLLEAEHLFDFPEPSQAFEEISLHNLFDVELDESEGDPNEEAVDGMFPNWMLSEDHSADSGAASGDSGVGEDLVEVNLDLKCYEEGLPPSGSETDEAEERAEEEKHRRGIRRETIHDFRRLPILPHCPFRDLYVPSLEETAAANEAACD